MQKQFEALDRLVREILPELSESGRSIGGITDSAGMPVYDVSDLNRIERDIELALVDLDMARNRAGVPHP